jgi:hypothetical protein
MFVFLPFILILLFDLPHVQVELSSLFESSVLCTWCFIPPVNGCCSNCPTIPSSFHASQSNHVIASLGRSNVMFHEVLVGRGPEP